MLTLNYDKETNTAYFNALKFARTTKQETMVNDLTNFYQTLLEDGVWTSIPDNYEEAYLMLLSYVSKNKDFTNVYDGRAFAAAYKQMVAGEPVGKLINLKNVVLIDFNNPAKRPDVGIVKKEIADAQLKFIPKFPVDNALDFIIQTIFTIHNAVPDAIAANQLVSYMAEANAKQIIGYRVIKPQVFDLHDLMLISNYTDKKTGKRYYIANTPKTKAAIEINMTSPWLRDGKTSAPKVISVSGQPIMSFNVYIDPTYAIEHGYLDRQHNYNYVEEIDRPNDKLNKAINRAVNNLFRALDVDTTILNRAETVTLDGNSTPMFGFINTKTDGTVNLQMAPNISGQQDWCIKSTVIPLGISPAAGIDTEEKAELASEFLQAPISRNDR